MWSLALSVVCLALQIAPSVAFHNHPAFDIFFWIGDTHVWYRNGNQPWWIEEEVKGVWYESWYEEKLDVVGRKIHLHDWNRGIRAVITDREVLLRSEDGHSWVQKGRFGWPTFTANDGTKIGKDAAGKWELTSPDQKRVPLLLIESESTDSALVFQGPDKSVYRVGHRNIESMKLGETTFSQSHTGSWEQETVQDTDVRSNVEPDEIINPGKKIAMLTLNTPNIHNWAMFGEANQKHYAMKHGYTLYIYRRSLLPRAIVTWNKVIAVPKHLRDHEYLMWIDSDAIITDMDKKIEDIIALAPNKNFLACRDIGGWMLNTGVMIFKRGPWAMKMLEDLWAMEHLGHDKAAEQSQLIRLLSQQDYQQREWQLFEQCEFNCHPRRHREGHYIMHMMGDSGPNRIKTFTEWNKKLGVDMTGLPGV